MPLQLMQGLRALDGSHAAARSTAGSLQAVVCLCCPSSCMSSSRCLGMLS